MSLIFWGSQPQRQQDSQQVHSGIKAEENFSSVAQGTGH